MAVKNTAIEKKKDAAALIRDHGLFWCRVWEWESIMRGVCFGPALVR